MALSNTAELYYQLNDVMDGEKETAFSNYGQTFYRPSLEIVVQIHVCSGIEHCL